MAIQINFSEIFVQLKQGVIGLAKITVSQYLNDAKKDGNDLLLEMKDDLERWTQMLITSELSTKDFEWLVNSEKDSIKMSALMQAGLSAIRVDQFKNSILNLIVNTVFSMIQI